MRKFVKNFDSYSGTTWIEEVTPDWEQRRYEIAKAALVGQLASPIIEGIDPNPPMQQVAQWAVKFADALIEELKK